jgi:hypothetical protein
VSVVAKMASAEKNAANHEIAVLSNLLHHKDVHVQLCTKALLKSLVDSDNHSKKGTSVYRDLVIEMFLSEQPPKIGKIPKKIMQRKPKLNKPAVARLDVSSPAKKCKPRKTSVESQLSVDDDEDLGEPDAGTMQAPKKAPNKHKKRKTVRAVSDSDD